MINLIPNQEKKKMTFDFYKRLFVVFFIYFGFSILVFSALLVPSYFAATTKKKFTEKFLADLLNTPSEKIDKGSDDIFLDLKNKLSLFGKVRDENFIVSDIVISQIVLKKTSDIKINKISYGNTGNSRVIQLYGIAPSRDRLLFFKRVLEDNVSFKKVDLPISNFVKGSNLEFSLTLVPN